MKLRKSAAAVLPAACLLFAAAASVASPQQSGGSPPAAPASPAPPPPSIPGVFPAPTPAPPLPAPKIDDAGQPPVPADDPYNESDPNRTPANMLSEQQIQALLENEESPFWKSARREVYGENGGTLQQINLDRDRIRHDVNGSVLGRAPEPVVAGRKLLALTFDDGPHTATTQTILDVLKQYHTPATFFFVGEMAARHPELVRAVFRDGHSVGNHTFHHVSLRALPEGDAITEIKACGNVLRAITGVKPHLFRPPGGGYNTTIAEDAAILGYTTILWTGDPGDYERLHPATIAQRTIACARPGGIIILHSGVWQTVRALPYIIESLRSAGYTLVTVDEMLKAKDRDPGTPLRTASGAAGRAAATAAPLR